MSTIVDCGECRTQGCPEGHCHNPAFILAAKTADTRTTIQRPEYLTLLQDLDKYMNANAHLPMDILVQNMRGIIAVSGLGAPQFHWNVIIARCFRSYIDNK